MIHSEALKIANEVLELLRPHCIRVQIAGSVRRMKPEPNDIEVVAIPKPYDVGLFESGLAKVVNKWQKVKGELAYPTCKYTQRILPQGIKLDLFLVEPGNYGNQLAVRTGSADYSYKVLATGWVNKGYHSENGYLTKDGKRIEVREEKELFELIGIPYVEPKERSL
jgi:DNA polymerase/3'-5' exonuclease PolX